MDQINSFEGGLNTDSAPERQDKNTYRYLLNGVDTSDKGGLLKITAEKGVIIFSGLMAEEGWKCIGNGRLNNDQFFLFVKGIKGEVGYGCRIGIVDYQGNYTTKVDDPLLGFNIDWPIQMEERISFNNHRIIYLVDWNNPDRVIDLDSTEPFNIANASLNANTSLPIVSFVQMNDGNAGELYTGAYQFVARYLNDDLSTSTFGFRSNIIPVVDDLKTVGRDGYDGAAPDTLVNNKTIQLHLSNLDPNKGTIEIIAIRYAGLALTPIITKFYQGNYAGTELDVEYTGLEKTTDIAIEEITVEPFSYISSKTVTQKDNRLIRGNLKGRTAANLQPIFNNISITYDVIEEVYDETNPQYFSDYKGEMQTFNKKTYMSEEVYAFSGRVVYKDGTRSLAYHIPAQNPIVGWRSADNYSISLPINYDPTTTTLGQKWYPSNFNTQTDGIGTKTNLQLGTYVSQLKYENGKDYPSTGINDGAGNIFIRHHLMPPIDVEPHFRNVGDVQYIRYKALRVSTPDFSSLAADEQNDIVGYEILRADRDLNNRSIVSQGLIQRTIAMESVDLGQDSSPYAFGDTFYMEAPGLSNFALDMDGTNASGDNDDAGFLASRNFRPVGSDNTLKRYQIGRTFPLTAPTYVSDLVTYYSPDFILGNIPLTPSTFKEKMRIRGSVEATKFQVQSGGFTSSSQDNFGIDMFCNYDENLGGVNIKFDTAGQFYYFDNVGHNLETSFQVPFGGGTRKVYEHFNTPHYWMRVNGGSLYHDTTYFELFLRINNQAAGADDDLFDNAFTILPINNTRSLINLQKNITQQYGPLGDLEYLPIAVIPIKNEIPTDLDGGNGQLRIFNGDIFISKFYFKNSSLLEIQEYAKEGKPFFPFNNRTRAQIDNFPLYKGMPIQSGSYFFVESTVNTNYRHQIPATPPSTAVGLPYYPKFSAADSNDTDPALGHPSGYNLAYSKNNNLTTTSERPFGFISVDNYPNRIVYSQQAIESEQQDSYRIFLANNFHDLAKNKGEIWNIENFNNILYAFCPQTTYRTYMNESTLLTGSYDSQDVFVGSGQLFSRPATELLTLAGGYAGSVSQFGGIATPSGYIFPDALQGKIFKINQGGLEEISAKGMQIYLNYALEPSIDAVTNKYNDNPFKGQFGITATYDAFLKRYIFTNHNIEKESFTLSYSFIANTFRSFHSYLPTVYSTNNNKFYAIDNKEDTIKLYLHNEGEYLKFYSDVKSNLELHFVENAQGQTIIPDNMQIASICKSTDNKTYIHLTQFDKIRVYNEKQNSDYINIITTNSNLVPIAKNEIKSSEKNNSFLMSFPKNAVIADNLDIFDPSNIDVNKLFKDRIKGFYAIVELTYTPNPIEDRSFTLNFIKTSSRINNFL